MSRNPIKSEKKAEALRTHAESRLNKGSAPPSGGTPLGRDALALLFEMASDHARSSEAKKLLHELQVHQVELDLQREELERSQYEMSRELACYKAIFESAPCLCLVITLEGRIIEANASTGEALGVTPDELVGCTVQEFLSSKSHQAWQEMLRKISADEDDARCELLLDTRNAEAVTLRLSSELLMEGEAALYGGVS